MARRSNSAFNVVGDTVEARSFQSGFRGAWFRCKIAKITKRQNREVRFLKYLDFPDDKVKEMKLYQVRPHLWGKGRNKAKELMLRPEYPAICKEKEMPNATNASSKVTVVVDNSRKVGDLVDWWSDGCYWSGKITRLFGDDKAQVELEPPPVGEGSSYEVLCKDLRPSLDWSPEQGWTVPCQEGESGCSGVRLMKPTDQGGTDGVSSKPGPSDAGVQDEAAKSVETEEEMITEQSPDKGEEEEEEEKCGNSSPKLAVSDEAARSTEAREEMIERRSLDKEEESGISSPKLASACPALPNSVVFDEAAKSTETNEETIKKQSPEGGNSSPELASVCPIPFNSAVPDEAAKSTETKQEMIKKRAREEDEEEEEEEKCGNSSPKLACGCLVPPNLAFFDEAARSTEAREEMITEQPPDKGEEEECGSGSQKLAGAGSVPSNLAVSDEAARSTETREEVIERRSPDKEEESGISSPKLASACLARPNSVVFDEAAKSTETKEETIKKQSPENEEEEGGISCPKLASACPARPNSVVFDEAAKSTETNEETIKKRSQEGGNCSPELASAFPIPSNSAVPDEAAKSTETKQETIKKRAREEDENIFPKLDLFPDSMESFIMHFEENLNKVKWLKRMLHGVPEAPQWECVENRAESSRTTEPDDEQREPRPELDSDNHENRPDMMDIDTD